MSDPPHGSGGTRPSGDPFTMLGGVQRRAVEQATAIIGRLLQVFDERSADDHLAADDGPEPDPGFAQLRAAAGRAVDLYVDLFQRTFESYVEMMEVSLRRRGVTVTGSSGDRGVDLVLETLDGHASVQSTLFVHNFSGAATGPLPVRVTDLVTHDESTIPSQRVDVEPSLVGGVADGSTVAIELRVDVGAASPGTYHGHAFAGEAALPIRLHVRRR